MAYNRAKKAGRRRRLEMTEVRRTKWMESVHKALESGVPPRKGPGKPAGPGGRFRNFGDDIIKLAGRIDRIFIARVGDD